MNTQIVLQQQAISAAKQQDWPKAIESNLAILAQNEADLGALNRLGLAQMQVGETKAAESTFKKVIALDKSNTIAKKHLARLKSNQVPSSPSFSQIYFIEEPGKTKIAELHRLAGKPVLDKLSVGQTCELKPKNRYISVESQGVYVGALPEDLSFRLTKLMSSGNEYACYIHSLTANSCTVYIQETLRSEANQYSHSFPLVKNNLAAINDLDEEFMLEDNIPVEMLDSDSVETADDSKSSFEVSDVPEE
jgi:hypothetical protein